MKTTLLTAAIVACALSAPIVSAQDKAASEKPAMGMAMGHEIPQMHENMKAMQAQMAKIRATTDPKERQKLMQAHMQAMQDGMKAMHGMGEPMMKGDSQPGGMAQDGKKDMAGGGMMKHHQMMEDRMNMMQMMMDQMLQHQQAMESIPAK